MKPPCNPKGHEDIALAPNRHPVSEADLQSGMFIRFLAACLIINSHFDLLYPWPFLATGGEAVSQLVFACL